MRRRELIGLVGGMVTLWPLALRAQQPVTPVIGFLSGRSQGEASGDTAAFIQGLNEMGYVDGRNVVLEYRWAEGRNELLPDLAADLVLRQVAVLAAVGGNNSALAAKRATATIPIGLHEQCRPRSSWSRRKPEPPGRECNRCQLVRCCIGAQAAAIAERIGTERFRRRIDGEPSESGSRAATGNCTRGSQGTWLATACDCSQQ